MMLCGWEGNHRLVIAHCPCVPESVIQPPTGKDFDEGDEHSTGAPLEYGHLYL